MSVPCSQIPGLGALLPLLNVREPPTTHETQVDMPRGFLHSLPKLINQPVTRTPLHSLCRRLCCPLEPVERALKTQGRNCSEDEGGHAAAEQPTPPQGSRLTPRKHSRGRNLGGPRGAGYAALERCRSRRVNAGPPPHAPDSPDGRCRTLTRLETSTPLPNPAPRSCWAALALQPGC